MATGTTRSCSPVAPRCSSSATSSGTTPRPRRPWVSCAGCCAASRRTATPAPAEVLRGLDASMTTLQIHALATATVARFEQTPDELERGITRMRWANAGHLPPLVVNPDGSVAELASWTGDLLLGVDPHHPAPGVGGHAGPGLDRAALHRRAHRAPRRRPGHRHGPAAGHAHRAGRLPLEELLDTLLERLVDGRPEDDVALVAVRLHRQDEPRPAEAGPNDVPPTSRRTRQRHES